MKKGQKLEASFKFLTLFFHLINLEDLLVELPRFELGSRQSTNRLSTCLACP